MRKYWRQVLTAVLAVVLLLLGLDIRFGLFRRPGCRLPALMYHHFTDEAGPGTMISGARFREQMTALKDAGFTAVTLEEVRDYVLDGVPLPAKPVLITMDDGYTSNLTIAAPVLEELGFCATVFMIGCYEGEILDFRSGNYIWEERFSYEQALPWVEKGVLDLQSHTYDMHQRPQTGGVSGREGALKKEGESAEDYRDALLEDFAQYCRRREGRVSTPLTALSYPFGLCSGETDRVLEEAGAVLTVTVREHCNTVFAGRPGTLRRLGRFNVDEDITGEALVRKLERWGRGFFV